MNALRVGDRVRWISAAGRLSGVISDISLSKNAANNLVPWIVIKDDWNHATRLCGTINALVMMKVEKI